jgi:hypothetical protein
MLLVVQVRYMLVYCCFTEIKLNNLISTIHNRVHSLKIIYIYMPAYVCTCVCVYIGIKQKIHTNYMNQMNITPALTLFL